MLTTLAAMVILSIPTAKPQIDRSRGDFRTAESAIEVALQCENLYGDPDIVNAAREIMIYALRNQGLKDPYKGADKVINGIHISNMSDDVASMLTLERCENSKYSFLAMMR